MRLTYKDYCGYDVATRKEQRDYTNEEIFDVSQKLGQLEDIEDNLPAFNGLQHLFKCIDLMENYEELHFTYKGKTFVIERNE